MENNLIDGVLLTPLKQIAHPKGDVFHAMKCVDPGFEGFGEAYFLVSSTDWLKLGNAIQK